MKLSKEIRIALVAILGIVIMYFGMNFLKGISLLSDDEVYYITFKDVNGLSASSPIFANGYQVGVVRGIDYDFANNSEIVVTFTVDDDLRIPKGSTAEIISDMMGKVKMNLLIAEDISQGVVNPGDTIVGSTEVDLSQNKISNESPIGKALLGAKKGETVEADAPAGKIQYKILSIKK